MTDAVRHLTDQVDPWLAVSGERLDRLMTVEARPMRGGLPPGLVVPMYDVCRTHFGEPLSTLAARRLIATVGAGDTVLIATGAGVPPSLPHGETDGPPGAAILARALANGLGANVIVVSEDAHFAVVSAAVSLANAPLPNRGSISCRRLQADGGMSERSAQQLFQASSPSAVVFVELDGPNAEGAFHGVRGDRRPEGTVARLHLLANYARARGILSVGVGDGGNEVGFGLVRNSLTAIHPNAFVLTNTATDIVVSASVSNWGAYAVAAAMAIALQNETLLHEPDIELSLIAACVAAGGRDGASGTATLAVDGIDSRGHASMIELMRTVVHAAIAPSAMTASPPNAFRDRKY